MTTTTKIEQIRNEMALCEAIINNNDSSMSEQVNAESRLNELRFEFDKVVRTQEELFEI